MVQVTQGSPALSRLPLCLRLTILRPYHGIFLQQLSAEHGFSLLPTPDKFLPFSQTFPHSSQSLHLSHSITPLSVPQKGESTKHKTNSLGFSNHSPTHIPCHQLYYPFSTHPPLTFHPSLHLSTHPQIYSFTRFLIHPSTFLHTPLHASTLSCLCIRL